MNSKAQAWYMDFGIAVLLFLFTLVVYYSYINNVQSGNRDILDVLLTESQSISSSLVLSGYPSNWDNNTVVRVGITDEQRINTSKLKNFKKLNYARTKRSFGTPYEYLVYFVNSKGEVLNIGGVCGVGHPSVNFTYNIKSAYYYQNVDDSFLKDFMIDFFRADTYFGDDANDVEDIDGLISNISKYKLVVLEHPLLTASVYNNYKDEIENFAASGNLLMISGELVTAQGKNLVGADFYKKNGLSQQDCLASINNSDTYLKLDVDSYITFSQCYRIENTSQATNFNEIAQFTENMENALSSWKFGNGTVYFFSDFDVTYINSNFTEEVQDAALGLAGGTCSLSNLTNIGIKNLAKTERYLIHESNIVKMVVYLWQ